MTEETRQSEMKEVAESESAAAAATEKREEVVKVEETSSESKDPIICVRLHLLLAFKSMK